MREWRGWQAALARWWSGTPLSGWISIECDSGVTHPGLPGLWSHAPSEGEGGRSSQPSNVSNSDAPALAALPHAVGIKNLTLTFTLCLQKKSELWHDVPKYFPGLPQNLDASLFHLAYTQVLISN